MCLAQRKLSKRFRATHSWSYGEKHIRRKTRPLASDVNAWVHCKGHLSGVTAKGQGADVFARSLSDGAGLTDMDVCQTISGRVAGQVTQQLGVLAALSENPSSVPSNHILWLITT